MFLKRVSKDIIWEKVLQRGYPNIRRKWNKIEEEERYLEEIEALIAKRLPKGASKYEWKLPLKCFPYNKTRDFASRCLKRVPKPRPNKPRF